MNIFPIPVPGLDRSQRVTLPAGSSALLDPGGAPWSLGVTLEAGATVTVEISLTPAQHIGADGVGAIWKPLGEPLVADDTIVFPGPVTALRLSAAGAGATVELVS